jgi:hypothetical protein
LFQVVAAIDLAEIFGGIGRGSADFLIVAGHCIHVIPESYSPFPGTLIHMPRNPHNEGVIRCQEAPERCNNEESRDPCPCRACRVLQLVRASAQDAPDAVDGHLVAARTAAGFDFTGTLARLCVAPLAVANTRRDVTPGTVPARETWFAETGQSLR